MLVLQGLFQFKTSNFKRIKSSIDSLTWVRFCPWRHEHRQHVHVRLDHRLWAVWFHGSLGPRLDTKPDGWATQTLLGLHQNDEHDLKGEPHVPICNKIRPWRRKQFLFTSDACFKISGEAISWLLAFGMARCSRREVN